MTPLKSIEKIGKFSSVTHGGHQFPTSLATHSLALLTFIIIADFKEKATGKIHKRKDFFRIVLCILTAPGRFVSLEETASIFLENSFFKKNKKIVEGLSLDYCDNLAVHAGVDIKLNAFPAVAVQVCPVITQHIG